MKKTFSNAGLGGVLVAMLCLFGSQTASAVNYHYLGWYDNIYYSFWGGGSPDEYGNIPWERWAYLMAISKSPDVREITIPSIADGHIVQTIQSYAGQNGCFEKLTFENPNLAVSDYCFLNCKNLVDVDLCDRVEYIGTQGFAGCTALQSIVIPHTKRIDEEAFKDCMALRDVVLNDFIQSDASGNGVRREINARAFTNCTALRNIELRCQKAPTCFEDCFDEETYAVATLFVPEGTLQTYRKHKVWGRFQNIVEGSISDIAIPEAPDGEVLCDVYTLAGVPVFRGVPAQSWQADAAPGIYIERSRDGKVKEIAVK